MYEKRNIKYFFSVEGETEGLYFQHLKKLICSENGRKATPVFRIEKISPSRFVKKISVIQSCIITAVYDVENDDPVHHKRFENILKEMRCAEKFGKSIQFNLGYSNIDFELWVLLHKKDLFACIDSKAKYLGNINQVFGTKFEGLKEYKEKCNFLQILSKITLNDVKSAITRAEKIYKQRSSEDMPKISSGYEWFDKNPSLSIHNIIKKILLECGV